MKQSVIPFSRMLSPNLIARTGGVLISLTECAC
jgi:hypothetical protein